MIFGIYSRCTPLLLGTQVSNIGPSWSSCFQKNALAHRQLKFEPYDSARYGMTKFWDLSPEEFKGKNQLYTGFELHLNTPQRSGGGYTGIAMAVRGHNFVGSFSPTVLHVLL